ncbi:hypothetical protein ACW0S0_09095 [Fusobacterium polymorphum]|nr:hypothetical protein [Fusobacterium polymorphum]
MIKMNGIYQKLLEPKDKEQINRAIIGIGHGVIGYNPYYFR